jgi:hypothetical protein
MSVGGVAESRHPPRRAMQIKEFGLSAVQNPGILASGGSEKARKYPRGSFSESTGDHENEQSS